MSNTIFDAAVPQTRVLMASGSDLGLWRDRIGSQHDTARFGGEVRVTNPAAGTCPSTHNSMTQPMGVPLADGGRVYAAKQAAPPRGRHR